MNGGLESFLKTPQKISTEEKTTIEEGTVLWRSAVRGEEHHQKVEVEGRIDFRETP